MEPLLRLSPVQIPTQFPAQNPGLMPPVEKAIPVLKALVASQLVRLRHWETMALEVVMKSQVARLRASGIPQVVWFVRRVLSTVAVG